MNPITFHLTTTDIRKNACAFVSQLECGQGHIVTIKNEKEARNAAQSRLRWVWMTQLEKELAGVGKGRDKDQWNLFFKHKYMRTLLIEQDEDYVPFFHNYDDMCGALADKKPLLDDYKVQYWRDFVKTEWLNVKMFSRYLDTIEKYVFDKYQVVLVTPDDLGWAK